MATRQAEQRAAQLRRLVLRMQRVLDARRWVVAYSEFLPPLVAADWTLRLWHLSFRIADEITRLEGAVTGDAA